jgi:hypothetical protein
MPFRDRYKRFLRGLSKYAPPERDDPPLGIVVGVPGQLRALRNDCDKWRTYEHGVIHTEVVTARGLHN